MFKVKDLKKQARELGFELMRLPGFIPDHPWEPIEPWMHFCKSNKPINRTRVPWREFFDQASACLGIYFIASSHNPPEEGMSFYSENVIYIGQTGDIEHRLKMFWQHVKTGSGSHWGSSVHWDLYGRDEERLRRLWFSFRPFDRDCLNILKEIEEWHFREYKEHNGGLPLLNRGQKVK